MRYIVAGNGNEFRKFVVENGWAPWHVSYIASALDLRGITIKKDDRIYYVGTYRERNDWHLIRLSLSLCKLGQKKCKLNRRPIS